MSKFVIKKDGAGKFSFELKARNGQSILYSEHYYTKSALENNIASVRSNSQDEKQFEKKDLKKDGSCFFNLKALNGQVMAKSGAYQSKAAMMNGIYAVMKCAPEAKIVDLS